MTWADVQSLRKSGRFQEAINLGLQELADDPDDFKLRMQIDWAFYGLVKNHVSSIVSKLKGGQPAPNAVVNQIHQALRCYAQQPTRRPDNERWLRSFGQYFLFLRWNLCLVLGCLFDRRQHHGIRFVRGPFL